ncbi:MAG: hypothetical protein HQM10_02930 [Candidatus Riflebacteria bacterium]|nr:hypothetical protein [Candidatus Riflebacteria bacterium]
MNYKKTILLVVVCSFVNLSSFVLASPVSIKKLMNTPGEKRSSGSVYDNHSEVEVQVEFGIASWYHCAEKPEKVISEKHKIKDRIYPVAHRTLPFGTLIKVINPRNSKKILARVIDRGPYIGGRVIDLDPEAARELEVDGVSKIILKIFRKPQG